MGEPCRLLIVLICLSVELVYYSSRDQERIQERKSLSSRETNRERTRKIEEQHESKNKNLNDPREKGYSSTKGGEIALETHDLLSFLFDSRNGQEKEVKEEWEETGSVRQKKQKDSRIDVSNSQAKATVKRQRSINQLENDQLVQRLPQSFTQKQLTCQFEYPNNLISRLHLLWWNKTPSQPFEFLMADPFLQASYDGWSMDVNPDSPALESLSLQDWRLECLEFLTWNPAKTTTTRTNRNVVTPIMTSKNDDVRKDWLSLSWAVGFRVIHKK